MLSSLSVSRMFRKGQHVGGFSRSNREKGACQSSLLVVMLRLRWQSLRYVNVIHSRVGCTGQECTFKDSSGWDGIPGIQQLRCHYEVSAPVPRPQTHSRVLWCMAVISHMRGAGARLSDWLCMGLYFVFRIPSVW